MKINRDDFIKDMRDGFKNSEVDNASKQQIYGSYP